MKKNIVFTISRQFGSNGREIGRRLAEYLDIGYYNKEIMKQIADDLDISPKFFEEKNLNDSGFLTMTRSPSGLSSITEFSVNGQFYEKAKDFIRSIANTESAVIIGRCSDYILKDNPNCISVFIYKDYEDRIRWAMDEYNVPKKKVERFVQVKDSKRSGFYEYYTSRKWGDPENYDVMINMSRMSVEEAVELLASIYDKRLGVSSIKGAFQDQYLHHKDMSPDKA